MRPLLLVLTLLAPAALGQAPAAAQPDQTRPLEDIRFFIGVIPTADGFDLYWQRTNELARPVTTRIYRTSFSHDGRRLASRVVHEAGVFEFMATAAVAGDRLIVFWRNHFESQKGLHFGYVEDDRLIESTTPLTGLIGWQSPQVLCEMNQCIAMWSASDQTRAAWFTAQGIMDGDPFPVPAHPFLFHPSLPRNSASISENGVLLLRSMASETFAILIDHQGRVVFDTPLPVPPGTNPAIARAGIRFLVFWDQHRGTTTGEGPRDLWSVEIGPSGQWHDLRRVAMSGDGRRSWLNIFNAVWTGHEFLLAGARWIDYVPDMIALPLDPAAQPIGDPLVLPRRQRFPGELPFLARVHDSVVIGWRLPLLQIAVYANGRVGPATEVEPAPRRRAASR